LILWARVAFIFFIYTGEALTRTRQTSAIDLINVLLIKIITILTIKTIALKLACQTIRRTQFAFILNQIISCLADGAFS
jgi:hypothetical protein